MEKKRKTLMKNFQFKNFLVSLMDFPDQLSSIAKPHGKPTEKYFFLQLLKCLSVWWVRLHFWHRREDWLISQVRISFVESTIFILKSIEYCWYIFSRLFLPSSLVFSQKIKNLNCEIRNNWKQVLNFTFWIYRRDLTVT